MVTRTALLSVLLIAGVAGAAIAQDEETEVLAACTSEYVQFCSNVIPGRGRLKKCLRSNISRLSAACKAQVQQN